NGFQLKHDLVSMLRRAGHDVVDEGDAEYHPQDDFPQFAGRVVNAMLADEDNSARGILICASGQGMCIAANRHKGIRASLCWDLYEARASRNDDDSNVLCLPSRVVSPLQAEAIVTTWLATPFAGAPRFVRRLKELDSLG
ncbi:MAG TPA: RpiB/LacA/LacB family sugar-phosphate isomerase, partial [Patescibacteria group bacterium]|nr:RpiB/LacA/LacB family sugar-phosphate isomerase [Patescibacteria group bacterium]